MKLLWAAGALLIFLAGVGAENVITKVAAWWVLTGQRRRDRRAERERIKRVMSATALLGPPGSQLSQAVAQIQARPFLIEIPRFATHEMVCAVLRRVMIGLSAQDRRRYFPGDRTGGLN